MNRARWLYVAAAVFCTGGTSAPREQAKPRPNASTRVALEKKGYVVPSRYVLVSPAVSGRVITLHFEEGKRVKKGELLAELDPALSALEYERAGALVEVAKARWRHGTRSKESAEVAKAELAAADLARASAKYRLDATKICAPCDGMVLSRDAEEGAILDGRNSNGTYSVCKLFDPARMSVDVRVEERDIHRVFLGQKCAIRIEAFPDRTYNGEVTRVGPTSDRARSAIGVRVRIDVPKDDATLMPELGAVVSFRAKD